MNFVFVALFFCDIAKDEALYKKLACWCNNNKYEKNGAAEAATAKIEELTATIEMLTARSKELNTKIKELEADAERSGILNCSGTRCMGYIIWALFPQCSLDVLPSRFVLVQRYLTTLSP